MRPSRLLLASLACCATLPLSAQAHEFYAKAGFLGAGVGYAYNVSDKFALRADVTTIGTISRDATVGTVAYQAKLKADQLGVYGDWFVLGNGFRLSAGVHFRDLKVTADGRPTAAGTITVNNTVVNYGANDAVSGRIKFPSVAPYIGIGWGHHNTQKPGFGFIADLGVSFGSPSTTLSANANLTAKLNTAAAFLGTTGANEIEAERRALADKADKLKIFPHLSIGVSYRF